MKMKKLGITLAFMASLLGLASCGSKTKPGSVDPEVVDTTGDGTGTGTGTGTGDGTGTGTGTEKEPEVVTATEMSVSSYGGDQESAYIEFNPVAGATNYKVLVKQTADSNNNAVSDTFKEIDQQLIRKYASGDSYIFRADAVGLASGAYDLKVTYTKDNETVVGATVSNIRVVSYDRSGFAFCSNQYNSTGDASGAYNADGTLKSNARVLYVSASNAKTVQLSVNTKEGEAVLAGLQNILDAYEDGVESRPLAIRVLGEITAADMDSFSSSEEGLQFKGKNASTMMNITLEGIGNDAFFHGFGILAKNAVNFEIRNLGFATLKDDNVSLDGSKKNFNIWVHDNDFFYGANGGGDKAKGDGALDIKGTYYATLSYNHFFDTGKTTLNSNTKSGDPDVDYVSYHHNWYDHSDSRHPRIRLSTSIHVYNNYFDGVSKYGVGVTTGSSAFVENNYFRNCSHPMLSSLQGTDAKGDGTFSSESGGNIKAYNNTIIFEGAMAGFESHLVYANAAYGGNAANPTSYDAYLASSRDEVVPSTYKTVSGGYTYSNFDTASTMYSYTVQTPEAGKETTMNYAGRVQGGDIKWTFDNTTEDTNYDVISGLRTTLDSYKNTKLLAVLGIDE